MLKTIKGFLQLYRLHDKFDKLVWAKDFRKIVEFAEEVKSRFPNRPIGYFYSGYGKLNLSKYKESKTEFLVCQKLLILITLKLFVLTWTVLTEQKN